MRQLSASTIAFLAPALVWTILAVVHDALAIPHDAWGNAKPGSVLKTLPPSALVAAQQLAVATLQSASSRHS